MQAIRYAKAKTAMSVVRMWVGSLYPNPQWIEKTPPTKTIEIPATRVKKYKIILNIYEPAGAKKHTPGGPVLINWHGSLFVFNTFWGSTAAYCRRMADDLGIIVIDASYPQAPEYPYPQGLHTAVDVINYVCSDPYFGNPSVLAVSGFSSGGNVALNMASSELAPALGLSKENQAKIKACAVSAALTAFHVDNKQKDPNDDGLPDGVAGLPIGRPALEIFTDVYTLQYFPRTTPNLSPSLADPKSYSQANLAFVTGSHDPYRFEGLAMHEALVQAGVNSTHYRAEGVGHAFELQGGDDQVAWGNDSSTDSPLAKARLEGYATMRKVVGEGVGKPYTA
ncbi:hypothetical protein OC846_003357 [Tilletia horrida]|uniref:Alpha/beta hydrolase fold-3 domain-containing protein n=1 Tax=Tilletia horrida TaxID=155126 RepID=A0AAN6GQM1_9BASI|nr:hypothetical protein OC845_003294 [Tilletia horrida]KAK0551298.1 hypothetical protein OC846_003357 [Tilletia horrida]KAK0567621.1 hypothetical protein OC861_002641 [Tilletia horrida]